MPHSGVLILAQPLGGGCSISYSLSSRLAESLIQVGLDLVLAALNVLNQVSQSCAVFHSGNLLAINSFLINACGLTGTGGKSLEVVGTVELTMVNVLLQSRRKGSRCLLLFEDAGVHVVRIFLVYTHVVPHLLLLNTIAKEAEATALTAVQVLSRLIVHAQPSGQLLQCLVLMALVTHVPRGLSLNRLKAIEAETIAILLGHQGIDLQVVPAVTISSAPIV